jgi:ATP-dependent Zn protease
MSNPISQEIDNSLEIKSNSIAQTYQQSFSNSIGSAQILSNIYNAQLENFNMANDFYQSYVDENEKLQNVLDENSSNSLTNNRKSYYEDQGIDNLKWWNALFFRLYIILIIAYVLFFFVSSSNYGVLSKIFILILLVAYIFIAPLILKFLITLYYRATSVLPKNAYLNI